MPHNTTEIEPTIEFMVNWLSKLLPLSKEQIVEKAIKRYFYFHNRKSSVGSWKHDLCIEQSYRCYYCKNIISEKTATLDHKQPLRRGGEDVYKNLCATCVECNNEKGNMTEEEFIEMKKFNPQGL